MWQMESVCVFDFSAIDVMRSRTNTADFTPRRGLLDELTAGKRLIVQVGNLRILALDLATAKPDVVEFKEACYRMYADLMRPPQRWAMPSF